MLLALRSQVEASGSRLWLPSDEATDLLYWHAATDSATLTLDGSGNVSTWTDKSGLGNSPAQGAAASRPAPVSNTINGLTAVVFDGIDDFLTAALASTPANWSTFAIWKPTSVSGVQSIVDTDNANTSANRHAQDIRQNDTALESIAFNSVPQAFTDGAGATLAANVPVMASSVRGATSVETWANGSSNGSTPTSGTNATAAANLTFGANTGSSPANTTSFAHIGLGETVGYSAAVSATLRQKVEGYLAWKWGLQASLPVGHAYAAAAPTVPTVVVSAPVGLSTETDTALTLGLAVSVGPG
jgi:hypothetical protein